MKQVVDCELKRGERRGKKMPDLEKLGCYSRFSGWSETNPMTRS